MGVITVNLALDVEIWFRGLPKGKRSAIINNALREIIQSRTGDIESRKVGFLTWAQLIHHGVVKALTDEEGMPLCTGDETKEVLDARNNLCALIHEVTT